MDDGIIYIVRVLETLENKKPTFISKFLQRTSPVDRLAEGRFSVYRFNVNKRFVLIRSNKLDFNR